MTYSQKLKMLIPFILLFSLLGLLWHELFSSYTTELPSALIGERIPNFQLPVLQQSDKTFTQKNLVGQVSLLNVWATWCTACGVEHDMLMTIKNKYNVPIYGIDYKDNARDAAKWLRDKGNPYVMIGNDITGDVGIDLGVYGTPETFILNKNGDIVYRHVGSIDQDTWDNVLYPIVQKYQNENP